MERVSILTHGWVSFSRWRSRVTMIMESLYRLRSGILLDSFNFNMITLLSADFVVISRGTIYDDQVVFRDQSRFRFRRQDSRHFCPDCMVIATAFFLSFPVL